MKCYALFPLHGAGGGERWGQSAASSVLARMHGAFAMYMHMQHALTLSCCGIVVHGRAKCKCHVTLPLMGDVIGIELPKSA